MKKLSLICALFFAAPLTHAALVVNTISGASNYTITPATTTPGTGGNPATTTPGGVTIYGGTAGIERVSIASCNGSACNTCTAPGPCNDVSGTGSDHYPLCACNTQAIYPGLIVRISVSKNPGPMTGVMRVSLGTPGASGASDITFAPQAGVATFKWESICNGLTNTTPQCTGTGGNTSIVIWNDVLNNGNLDSGDEQLTINVRVAIPGEDMNVFGDPTDDGIEDFAPFPGDERIYFSRIDTVGSWPSAPTGEQIGSVRAYVSTKSMDTANPSQATVTQDMAVPANGGDIERPFVENVNNDQIYFVRLALVDKANNVIQFVPDPLAAGFPADCTGTGNMNCPWAVTPEKVLGLLTKDFNCFVATAAYGTSLEPKLKVFRNFRMELLTHSWGKDLVLAYYHYGPYAARAIADSEILRAGARGLLWPAFAFSWLALKIGFYQAAVIALTLLFSFSALTFITIRRIRARA